MVKLNNNQGNNSNKKQPKKKANRRTRMRDRMNMETVAVTNVGGVRVPKTVTRNGGTVVTHSETYAKNIVGTSSFELSDIWAVQPGLATYSRGQPLGTWLPQIAANFDNYEFESLKFKYRTACSTLTSGLAIFAFEPNPEGTAPASLQEMRNMYSVNASVHTNFEFDVSQKVKGRKLIRKGGVVNLPSYDMGKVYFATIGVNDSTLVGFIDVEYRVRLINPQASQTTTVENGMISVPVRAMQRFEADTSSFGAINCAAHSLDYFNALLGSLTSSGAPLAVVTSGGPCQSSDLTFLDANKFTHNSFGSNLRALRFPNPGRYRITFMPRLDFEDLKMFAVTLFQYEYLELAWKAINLCRTQIYSDIQGSSTSTLPVRIYEHRGFAGTAVGDPNPATEIQPVWSWEILADKPNFDIVLKLGVLTYNSVSTTTANVQGRTGLGKTILELEYLGPVENA